VDSHGAFRVSTLGELRRAGIIADVDFGTGVLLRATNKGTSKSMKTFDTIIVYYFSNRSNTAQMMAASGAAVGGDGAADASDGGDGSGSSSGEVEGGGIGSRVKKTIPSDQFVVTSVYENDFVIDEFELSTDELVSLNKSSLREWRPTGSNTTFQVEELLAFMKDLQLRELLLRVKVKK
jgi:hypothetical protein